MAVVISSLDLYYFCTELSQSLLNGKVEQIYQHDTQSITIRFYKAGLGKLDLFIHVPKGLYLTKEKPASSAEQFGFCGILRKYLPGATLSELKQLGFSRTLSFTFSHRDEAFTLIVELYDKGNIILLDNQSKILAPLQVQRWEHRTIASGELYTPELTPLPQNKSSQQLADLVAVALSEESQLDAPQQTAQGKSNLMTASKFATTKFALGKVYGALLCRIAGVFPDTIITLGDAQKLFAALPELFNQKLSPCVRTRKESNAIDWAYPFTHPLLDDVTPIASLSAAYEQALFLHDKPIDNPKLRAMQNAQKKLQNIMTAQQASIAQLEREVIQFQEIGTLLYSEHAHFDKLLVDAKKVVNATRGDEQKKKLSELGVIKHDSELKTITVDYKAQEISK